MTEREYPRWVHAEGHKSIIVETAEEEAAFIAATAPQAVAAANVVALVPPQRYDLYPLADASGVHEAESDAGKWVRWSDVAILFRANSLTAPDSEPVAESTVEPMTPADPVPALKRTGGWPKGKPRTPKEASVN